MRDRGITKRKPKPAIVEAIEPESPQPRFTWPIHWIPGQLLDLKRYTDGSYLATALGEEYDAQKGNGLMFPSSYEAQAFTSWWYLPAVRSRAQCLNSIQR